MKIRRWLLLVPLLALPAAIAPAAVASAGAAPPPGLRTALDQAVSDGYPGILAYAQRGDQRWRLAAGVADKATGRPADPGDRFRIASSTKAFVATVVLQLVGEHRLTLDDPVSRWLPWVRSAATVRQVLNHTSGIWDPTTEVGFWAPYLQRHDMSFVYRPRDIVATALAHGPDFPPGTSSEYSNTNYLVAGLLIEAVTGKPADVAIRQRLIEPLHLSHTSMPVTDPTIPGRHLHGYDLAGADVTRFSPSYDWTAGSMISTLDDLARFEQALVTGRLLAPAQQRDLLTTVKSSGYGLGVRRYEVPCPTGPVPAWETDGGGPGFTSIVVTTDDGTRQLILVGNVYDIGAELRGDAPVPDSAALPAALAPVFCG